MADSVYAGWQRYAEEQEAHWTRRRGITEQAGGLLEERSEGARFVRAYLLVCEEERLWNRRFQLLMLLRARARSVR